MYTVCMITGYMSEVEILSWKWCALSEYKYTHVPVSMATNLQNEAYISKMAGDTTSWSTVLPLFSIKLWEINSQLIACTLDIVYLV